MGEREREREISIIWSLLDSLPVFYLSFILDLYSDTLLYLSFKPSTLPYLFYYSTTINIYLSVRGSLHILSQPLHGPAGFNLSPSHLKHSCISSDLLVTTSTN